MRIKNPEFNTLAKCQLYKVIIILSVFFLVESVLGLSQRAFRSGYIFYDVRIFDTFFDFLGSSP